ncbi:hypothetical protein NEOC95_002115 [Neochlamydia sp. AcF95]|nr:hypothetical protein [Neochlamydia sp. AcF95]
MLASSYSQAFIGYPCFPSFNSKNYPRLTISPIFIN